MEKLIWKKEYETGVVLIDKQHRILVDIINNLHEAHAQTKEKEILRETIIKLVDYTKYHFNYEEKHMTQFFYNKIEGHKKLHKIFIGQIVEILEELKKGDYRNLTDDILKFLTNWLIDHILKHDREYGHFYKMKIKYV